ncbi:MAG: hypothetical protein L0332_22240 [Chloroflexi bacterium]|nr:hypothetical protein [Chloroflexota bacterium]MCI0650236.1 hypothetical protein [Chloroflexota bacterium]MCI0729414.1 hypothetical protein [Chloroflexota bacterium]
MSKRKQVDTLTLRTDRPTELTFAELYTWVIWQFPRKKAGGLCGAVRPPLAGHGWFPALVKSKEKRVLVHGHLPEAFLTPQAAAEWLAAAALDKVIE